MGKIDIETLAVAKSYVNETMAGGGAVVGKNVIVKSIDPIDGGNRITFGYTLDNGTEQTQTLDVMDGRGGKDGENGISPVVKINNNEDGTVTLTIIGKDGTETTPNLKGDL